LTDTAPFSETNPSHAHNPGPKFRTRSAASLLVERFWTHTSASFDSGTISNPTRPLPAPDPLPDGLPVACV